MYSSNLKGFILAVVSSAFIGSSFIIKKKGLRRAGVNGPRASKFPRSFPFYLINFFIYLYINSFLSFSNYDLII